MWPDRVSNPEPSDLRVRFPTDCATRPATYLNKQYIFSRITGVHQSSFVDGAIESVQGEINVVVFWFS